MLQLYYLSLTEPQTRALITAMRDKVEDVWLRPGVTLDIEALCQYNGRGTCRRLQVRDGTIERYGERLRRWTEEVGWAVTIDDYNCLIITGHTYKELHSTHFYFAWGTKGDLMVRNQPF